MTETYVLALILRLLKLFVDPLEFFGVMFHSGKHEVGNFIICRLHWGMNQIIVKQRQCDEAYLFPLVQDIVIDLLRAFNLAQQVVLDMEFG